MAAYSAEPYNLHRMETYFAAVYGASINQLELDSKAGGADSIFGID